MKKAKTIAISAFSIIFIVLTIKDMGKLQNLTGKTVGQIQVIELYGRSGSGRNLVTLWLCKCLNCNREFTSKTGSINSGSVGCLPCSHKANETHGMWTSKEYRSWQCIRQRCYNPNHHNYKLYGARGIVVCDSWRDSFESFFEDMGYAPSKNHTIDRIEVNGNYEKSNCRWATMKEQSNNKRNNTYLTFKGETLTQKQWCERLGLKESTVHNRLLDGMSVEEALTKPVRLRSPNLKTQLV